MRNKVLVLVPLIVLALCATAFGADNFTTKVAQFINTTVLTWVRIIGAMVVIGGVIGWAGNRNDQDKMSAMVKVMLGGAAIFGVGEIVGLLFSTFRTEQIIDISSVIVQNVRLG